MEALKAQIASQKRKIAQEHNEGNKYMRRGDIQEIASQNHVQTSQEIPTDLPESNDHTPSAPPKVAETAGNNVSTTDQDGADMHEALDMSADEAMDRLREKFEPIRLFGESDQDCIRRLLALENTLECEIPGKAKELMVKDLSKELGGDAEENPVSKDQETDARNKDRVPARMREGVGMQTVMDLKLMWTDTPRVYPIIYYTLKGLLEDWETELEQRPDIVKRSEKGQKMSELHAQTVINLKPLFKLLRRRSVESDVLLRIAEIVHYMQQREYRKANDSYLQLSIGNAPWPIGITMAGYVHLFING